MKLVKKLKAVVSVLMTVIMLSQIAPIAFAETTDVNDELGITNITEESSYKQAEIIAELTDNRDGSTKHFMMSDGNNLAVQYAISVHYQNSENKWIQYDNRMKEAESILDTSFKNTEFSTEYKVISSDKDIRLSKEANDKKLVSVLKDG